VHQLVIKIFDNSKMHGTDVVITNVKKKVCTFVSYFQSTCFGLKGPSSGINDIYIYIHISVKRVLPVPVAARSKAQVYGLSPTKTVGSNPTGGMDVCLFRVLCVVR